MMVISFACCMLLFFGRRVRSRVCEARILTMARARRWALRKFVHLRALTQEQIELRVERVLDSAANHLRRTLKDQAMPSVLQRSIDQVMDSLLPDVKQECWRLTDEHFLPPMSTPSVLTSLSPLSPRRTTRQTPGRYPALEATSPGHGGQATSRRLFVSFGVNYLEALHNCKDSVHMLLYRYRAWVLHTLWPHDRSVWSSARTASWWGLQVLGLLPWLAQLWWLLLSASVDKQDEYQLCQFIVALRTSHFLTLGVGAAMYGCFQAYRCALLHKSQECAAISPSISLFSGCFWLVQIAITARSFSLLPLSRKKGQRVAIERRSRLPMKSRLILAAGDRLPPDAAPPLLPGGVLYRLGHYDIVLAAATLTLALLSAIFFGGAEQPLGLTLFWLRTCHGLLSFPYLLFKLPLAHSLLTHARRTGYDSLGNTVPHVTPRVADVDASLGGSRDHDNRATGGASGGALGADGDGLAPRATWGTTVGARSWPRGSGIPDDPNGGQLQPKTRRLGGLDMGTFAFGTDFVLQLVRGILAVEAAAEGPARIGPIDEATAAAEASAWAAAPLTPIARGGRTARRRPPNT